jgi:hypothetical protein
MSTVEAELEGLKIDSDERHWLPPAPDARAAVATQ